MKICIYGAGAIGGYLGVMLARGGAEVSLVARGAQREAIVAHGLRLRIGGEELCCELRQKIVTNNNVFRLLQSVT